MKELYQGFATNEQNARISKGKSSQAMIGGIGDAIGGMFGTDE